MKAGGHLVLSTAVGTTVWVATDTPAAVPIAVATGALVDADHLLDAYFWYARRRPDLLIVALHAWEYLVVFAVVGLAAGWHPLFWAALMGYLSHLVSDQIANSAGAGTYFLAYRIKRRFSFSDMFTEGPAPTFNELLATSIPMYGRIKSWLSQ